MFYKILPGSPLFDRLTKLKEKMYECNNKALDFAKNEMGYSTIRGGHHVLAGGISAIQSKDKPKGYKAAYKGRDVEAWFPADTTKNAELLARIKALPVVEHEDLNKLVKYDSWSANETDNRICFYPATHFSAKYILMKFPDFVTNYKPTKDMIEITNLEYDKLFKIFNKTK
jgi:hypothetical protein